MIKRSAHDISRGVYPGVLQRTNQKVMIIINSMLFGQWSTSFERDHANTISMILFAGHENFLFALA